MVMLPVGVTSPFLFGRDVVAASACLPPSVVVSAEWLITIV